VPTYRLVVTTSKKLAALVSEALFAAGAQGIEERPGRGAKLVAFAERRPQLATLWRRAQRILEPAIGAAGMPTVDFETDAQDSWKTAWTEHLRPVRLTPRLLLAPVGHDAPAAGRRLLVYEPALAFGDGNHATTRMAARAIERHYRAHPGGALLDLGTGSGVLSLVAVLSGARRALGTDIDATSLRAAAHNAKLNGVSSRTRFVHSSARVTGRFDLAVVNIELRPLLQVLADLPSAARRVPRLLVTGILESQARAVTAALKATGFRARRLATEGDWLLLEGRPST
jgi:ribosomal protein L11 methyltransferase